MKIYFAADHAGFELKNILLAFARDELGYEVEDCGAERFDANDDYPEIIARAALKLSANAMIGGDNRAIVIGASGQGEAMVANRFKGVRCALYYGAPGGTQKDMSGKELGMLASTREHNDANALSLGARFLSAGDALAALKQWLSMGFSGEERHLRRIQKIEGVD
jgi:ribose 5-phosphate isomerase B